MSKKNKYKILIVLPFYGGSLPIGRFAANGLKQLGHLVEVFESPLFYSAFQGLKKLRIGSNRLEYLEQSFIQVVSQAIYAKVEEFSPSLVLALAQAPLTRQILLKLKKQGVPTAMWFVEDFKLFTYWRAFAPLYDFFAVIQKEPFFQGLRNIGVKNFCYLPLACCPEIHKPLVLNSIEKKRYGSDISFMGAGYPNRRKAFIELLDYDFKIWGTEWEGETSLEPLVQEKGRRLEPEEIVKIFNATKINLNLHSSIKSSQLVSKGDFVNPRTFEIAGCRGFQLVDERSLLSELFKPEEEIITFSSIEDLKKKIDFFLEHEDKRNEIAAAAYSRAISEHTYSHRMERFLEFVANKTNLSYVRGDSLNEVDLPEDLRDELEEFLARLGLNINSEFEEVIHRLRQENGELSPIEAALLFLDEWKKQYLKNK
ncbi:glycosyltransferase family protein [Desulfonauticus submarinus]